MTAVTPGKMRHRVNLKENNPTTDAAGQEIANWVTYDTVWASIMPVKGREYINADQLKTSETTHRIMVRWHKLLTTKHRIYVDTSGAPTLRNRAFEIDSILNIEEREIMQQVMCKEIV